MKIPSETRKQLYELTYLTSVGLTSDEQKAIADKIEKLIKKHKGTVKNTEDWGKKVLAYTIKSEGKRHTEAIYTHLVVELVTDKVAGLEKELNLQQEIFRHLLVVAEEHEPAAAETTEQAEQKAE